ncbi:hypothetical protein BurJ1DRAFT_2310 [Burkholderiales bacterium JOSHI_001]|nr:hypothetical protein BurJ1DRAFT_2310 [Burkholderiales bacterium JOSHI_001]
MSCTETPRAAFPNRCPVALACWATLAGLVAVAGCAHRQEPAPVVSPGVRPAAAPNPMMPTPAAPARAATTRNWDEWQRQAAQRIVQANPNGSYMGDVKQPLLAIPVLEVELHGDGSIRNIVVSRRPGQAPETLQMAIDAVRRAEPFAPVSHLPRPWKYTEVFLFNDQRRFKPRTLDD